MHGSSLAFALHLRMMQQERALGQGTLARHTHTAGLRRRTTQTCDGGPTQMHTRNSKSSTGSTSTSTSRLLLGSTLRMRRSLASLPPVAVGWTRESTW